VIGGPYVVVFSTAAARQYRKLDRQIKEPVRVAIEALGNDPRPPGAKAMVNSPGLRIRVGDWRVIYEVKDEEALVVVTRVGHRRDIYRQGGGPSASA
jgi:mRNA interferase RelE/StbE